jgi:hypothetical protein
MKKYLLFAGKNYYPNGGVQDFVMDSEEIGDLCSHFRRHIAPAANGEVWGQIVLSETMEIILSCEFDPDESPPEWTAPEGK